jgi:hypothetical protein
MSPSARVRWLGNVYQEFEWSDLDFSGIHMLTVIHEPWFTSRRAWKFDPEAIKRALWNGLRGLNYWGMIEFAWFCNRSMAEYPGHPLIAPHFQGVVWDIDDRVLDTARRRFSGGLDGTHPLWCQRVTDLAGALSYAVKAPSYGYSAGRPRPGRTPVRWSRKLTLPLHYFFFSQLGELRFSDLTVAGGSGCEIFRALRAATRCRRGDH